ncbi:serine protease, partial [Streptomyces sp. MZ04]|uniref:S1 family peptidase n=1 Tax=Streptomyces sp. MZ04 TaxID=2559236 RepID=UPI00107E9CE1
MQTDRVVQIRVPRPDRGADGKPRFGSGYLVAPRLVLTAAHVLGDAVADGHGGVLVSQHGGGQFAATVRWCRHDDLVDAALLEVDDGADWPVPASLHDLRAHPPQRWGQFIGTRPGPVGACGFPRLQKDATVRRVEQFEGHINPATGGPGGRYDVLSLDPLPAFAPAPGSKATKWSGISGAALLSGNGNLLVGVLCRDRKAAHGARLTAVRAGDLLAEPAFRTLLHQHSGWEPILEAVEPAALLAPAAQERDLRSPAMLLQADVEAVSFRDRHTELADLRDWCHREQPQTLAVRVLTGPGGQGKTRLARRLTALLRDAGWITGHLRANLTDDPAGPGPDWSVLDTARPRLLVVDYAETLPHQVRRLIEHLRTAHHPTRLLLLARAEGEWKHETLNATAPT